MTKPGAVDYFVVDVETANQARHSICQIGIAFFAGGKMANSWESLINPLDEFHPFNVALHGISPRTVAHAPSWSEVFPQVMSILSGAAVASHTDFDRSALSLRQVDRYLLAGPSRLAAPAQPQTAYPGPPLRNHL
jgi:DNA polymerase III epsilon subunit-like protein